MPRREKEYLGKSTIIFMNPQLLKNIFPCCFPDFRKKVYLSYSPALFLDILCHCKGKKLILFIVLKALHYCKYLKNNNFQEMVCHIYG